MMHLGDICKLKGSEVPLTDVLIGGSPCQNLSTAGNGKGLHGEESRLFIEQVRLFKEMRDARSLSADEHIRLHAARWLVWENVPGALHCSGGEDFRTVLEMLCRVCEEGATVPGPPKGKWKTNGVIIGDGYSLAWKVTDAQYWGVPQRRRRICIVLDADGLTAPEILFGEPKPDGSAVGSGGVAFDRDSGRFTGRKIQSFSKGVPGDTQSCESPWEGFKDKVSGALGSVKPGCDAYTMQDREGKPGGGQRSFNH